MITTEPYRGLTPEHADLLAEIRRSLPEDIPNYGAWYIELPAGHWRAIAEALEREMGEA